MVFWFTAWSQQSRPSVLYAAGDCEQSPEAASPHTCVYSSSQSLGSSQAAASLYCAVATCGHILFGNHTRLGSEGDLHTSSMSWCCHTGLVLQLFLCVLC